jgi:transposase
MSRTSRGEWAKRVERWKDSGLSAKEYAAETGVKASTLSYWRWRLGASVESGRDRSKRRSASETRRRGAVAVGGPSGRFVELEASATMPAPPALELVLSRGIRVHVAAGFDEATLTRLVRAVEAAS